jgi:prepilin-type N-terminal cleavage/methylation domain-containing protein
MMKSKKAFTLIELLVVIAIIAVLMGVLMPALQRVRMQAKNVLCKSNLMSYGLVMRLYNGDWNEGFPESFTGIYSRKTIDQAGSLAGAWHPSVPHEYNLQPDGAYIPYLKDNAKSNICPVFQSVYLAKWPERGKVGFTYSFNWWLNSEKPIIGKTTLIKRPSHTFFAGEECIWSMSDDKGQVNGAIFNDNSLCTFWSGDASLSWVRSFDINREPPYTDAFGEYHRVGISKINTAMIRGGLCGGVSNAVCVDGHVEEVTPYDTLKYAIAVK